MILGKIGDFSKKINLLKNSQKFQIFTDTDDFMFFDSKNSNEPNILPRGGM